MQARIIDRGRGPEIAGTRITVYTIMDFLRANWSAQQIADVLELECEQVQTAIDYIAQHQKAVDAAYEKILERVNQPNPPEVVRGNARNAEELKQRIAEKRMKSAYAENAALR